MIVVKEEERAGLTTYYSDDRKMGFMIYNDGSGCLKVKSEFANGNKEVFMKLLKGEEGYYEKMLWGGNIPEHMENCLRYLLEGSSVDDEEIIVFMRQLISHLSEEGRGGLTNEGDKS